ncbi:MAG: transposase domain-containing protein, partial [Myxococcales bacterium]|nr:transposase domain-containing protein [Myxococcales bacterium]
TLVQSGRRVGLPVRDYLTDILTKLEAGFPMRRIDELTPDRWALAHGIPCLRGEPGRTTREHARLED